MGEKRPVRFLKYQNKLRGTCSTILFSKELPQDYYTEKVRAFLNFWYNMYTNILIILVFDLLKYNGQRY
jgi:hypothetical protein